MPDNESLVDPSWELIDPTPDPIALFLQYNKQFFWGKLDSVTVSWSPRMTSCAGVCCYEGRGGLCSIRLSQPLLKLRPRKDLVETLLHEMIHAYLFVTQNNRDRDGHGAEFQKHMHRINASAKTNITIYHNFYDEVRHYKTHVWRCDGPCRNQKPFHGFVSRSTNRAPGPNDLWWSSHKAKCNGTFHKISEPEEFTKKQQAKKEREEAKQKKEENQRKTQITNYFPTKGSPKSNKPDKTTTSKTADNNVKTTSNGKNRTQTFHGANVLGGTGSQKEDNSNNQAPLMRRIPGFGVIPVRVPAATTTLSELCSPTSSSSSSVTPEPKHHPAYSNKILTKPVTGSAGSSSSGSNALTELVTLSSDEESHVQEVSKGKRKRVHSPSDKAPPSGSSLMSCLIDSDDEFDMLLTNLKETNSRKRSCAKPPIERKDDSRSPVHPAISTGGGNSKDTISQVKSVTGASAASSSSQPSAELCNCPVCGRQVALEFINLHMDHECTLSH